MSQDREFATGPSAGKIRRFTAFCATGPLRPSAGYAYNADEVIDIEITEGVPDDATVAIGQTVVTLGQLRLLIRQLDSQSDSSNTDATT